MNEKNIGTYIRDLRLKKKLTLSRLSEISNISQPYLSQIEKRKRNPSFDIIRKLSEAFEVDFTELAWRAGLYTDAEMQERRAMEAFFNSMTPEEEDAYIEAENKSYEVEEFRRLHHPDVKDVLKQRAVYFNGKSLNKEYSELATKVLEALFEKLEVNYPSKKEIEKEYHDFNNMFAFLNQDSSDRDKDK
ncbi:helix-turn-helix domain-containing protein [Bacillus toyonensis]|uniref:Transcriptional regulator n=1 Tax=Bacillus toyonensis TaxID=155322 RepID=A0A2A8GZB7_9BACI|nr:helix-turn-helix transcriptional regulator [Bacillus toyonensis]PEP85322.1 transcriptional regulator [Bacillus toyonensis]